MPLFNPPLAGDLLAPLVQVTQSGGTYYAYNHSTAALITSGTDAGAVIQAALDAMDNTYGGVVELGQGQFNCTTFPATTKDNVTIRGSGREATQITQAGNMSAGAYILSVGWTSGTTVTQNTVVRDLKIVGGLGTYSNGKGLRHGSSSCLTYRVAVQNTNEDGATFDGIDGTHKAYNQSIRECEFKNNNGDQCVLGSNLSDYQISFCYGFWGTNGSKTRTQGGHGFNTDAANGTWESCHAYFNTKNGWNVTSNGQHNSFKGCTAESNYWHGWYLNGWYQHLSSGNQAYNNGLAPSAVGGITGTASDVYLNSASHTIIQGNAFGKYTSENAASYNINASGGTNIVIRGNSCTAAVTAYMQFAGTTWSTVDGNQMLAISGQTPTKAVALSGANYHLLIDPVTNMCDMPIPLTHFSKRDDFVGGINSTGSVGDVGYGFAVSGTGAVSNVAATAGHPGLFHLDTGGTSGGLAAVRPNGNNIAAIDLTTVGFDLRIGFILNQTDANTAVRVGFGTDCAGTSFGTNSLHLEKAAADTNWFWNQRSGSADSRTDSTVAVTAAAHDIRIRRIDATHVGYTLDAGAEVSLTGGVLTAVQQWGAQIVNSASASKTIDIDYIVITLSNLSRA